MDETKVNGRSLGSVGTEKGDDGKWYNVFVDAAGKKHVAAQPTVDPFLPVDEQIEALGEELKASTLVVDTDK